MTVVKMKQSAKDGQAAGGWLAERAAHVLLLEYSNRKPERQSEAQHKLEAVMTRLRSALSSRADEPLIAEALHALDAATWDVVAEYEDRAWYAGWHTASGLITGATFSRMNSHNAKSVGSDRRRD